MKKLVLHSMFLTVSLSAMAQANDLCGNSQSLFVDAPCEMGSTIGAGIEDPTIDPALYPADVWYSFEAISNFSVVYVYPDLNVDPDLYMFDNCNGNVFAVGTAGVVAGETDSVFIETVPGTIYYISVVGWQDAPYGEFCIEVLSRNDNGYDPCTDQLYVDVEDPCVFDAVTSQEFVKTYTFAATSTDTYVTLDITGLFYLPAIAIFEVDCYGQMVRDWMEPYSLEGNHFMVNFSSTIGQQYMFGVINTDPSFSYQFPMEYCVDVQNLAEVYEAARPEIAVFPNPVRADLTISLGSNKGTVAIYDLIGQELAMHEGTGEVKLDLKDYKPGVYMVQTTIGAYHYLSKIVKE